VLLELAARGHSVHVRTLSSEVGMVRGLGMDAQPIDPAIEARELDDWRGRSMQSRLARSVATFSARAPRDAADLRAGLAAVRPDLLLVDVNSWGALAAAEAWGGPWATFCPYPLTLSSVDVPPFGPGLPPARGPLGRARDRAIRPLVLGTMERAFLPALNQVRAPLGLAPLASVDDMLLRSPRLLYFSAEPFEYRRSDWPSSVVQVGALSWEPPGQAPDWLEAITDPLVLVTTSSEFQDDGRLVRVALEALADEPVHVVATVPASTAASELGDRGNAHLVPFLPHSQVLARATCAITHGGMGATQKALAHGVPVVAVPFGRDQLEVARRVEVSGAGVRLLAGRLRADRLRGAVRVAVGRRDAAQRVAAGYRAAGGARSAADAVESLLVPSSPAP
jgi:MGT family glycosyltransferase